MNYDELNKMKNSKLVHIVRNYKQYGYETKIHEMSLEILEKRGIRKQEIKKGDFSDNYIYIELRELYNSFIFNSCSVTILYILTIGLWVTNYTAMGFVFFCVYLFFLGYTMNIYRKFHKELNTPHPSLKIIISYIILAIPFCFIILFILKNKLGKSLNEIK